MSDILENGPRRPRSPLRYAALALIAIVALGALIITRGHHEPRRDSAPPPGPTRPPASASPGHQLTGVALSPKLHARLLLAGDRLTTVRTGSASEQTVFTLNLQALIGGSFVTALQPMRDGVAAAVSGSGGTILLLRNGGSSVGTIAAANSIAAAADDTQLWLVDPSLGAESSSSVALIDQSGRVIRRPRSVPLSIYRGTRAGLVGYSARGHAIEIWDPGTDQLRRLSAADPDNFLLDGTSNSVAWTDDAASCRRQCLYLARFGATTRVSTIRLPSGYRVTDQPGAMSPDGTKLAVVISTGANRQVLLVDLRTGVAESVPGTQLTANAADVRLSLCWDPDGKALWIADSDDPDGVPAQLGRWPLSGPLQTTTTGASEVGSILRLRG
jgi:hypothetical protein